MYVTLKRQKTTTERLTMLDSCGFMSTYTCSESTMIVNFEEIVNNN